MDVAPRLCLWLRVQVEGPGNGSWSLRVSRHKGLSVGGGGSPAHVLEGGRASMQGT